MKYSLRGVNGNALSVVDYVKNAMKQEGASKEQIERYVEEALSGDYNKVLRISMEYLSDLNAEYEDYEAMRYGE